MRLSAGTSSCSRTGFPPSARGRRAMSGRRSIASAWRSWGSNRAHRGVLQGPGQGLKRASARGRRPRGRRSSAGARAPRKEGVKDMAERVGALIVELRANAVQFQAEMEKARGSLRRTGGSFSTAERTATRFAAQGLGSIIPGAQGASFALERVIQSTLRAGGAWRLLGQAGVIVGGVLAVAAGVQWLEANIRNWWRLGETVSQTLDRMKKAAEEQKQFAADRLRAVTLQAGLEKQLVQLRGQSAVATLRAIGAERSAEEAALTTRLELIDRERMERQRGITQSIAQGPRRERAPA